MYGKKTTNVPSGKYLGENARYLNYTSMMYITFIICSPKAGNLHSDHIVFI